MLYYSWLESFQAMVVDISSLLPYLFQKETFIWLCVNNIVETNIKMCNFVYAYYQNHQPSLSVESQIFH